MSESERTQLIDRYEQGAQLFSDALNSVPARLLDVPPAPGKWTIRQIAHHTVDAEVVVAGRFRAVAGEDGSPIQAFDQDRWAANMNYAGRSMEYVTPLFVALRHNNAAMLRTLPASAWQQHGVHSERGRQTLEDLLNLYIRHGENHARAIREAQQKLAAA
jgi:hypothetical protein